MLKFGRNKHLLKREIIFNCEINWSLGLGEFKFDFNYNTPGLNSWSGDALALCGIWQLPKVAPRSLPPTYTQSGNLWCKWHNFREKPWGTQFTVWVEFEFQCLMVVLLECMCVGKERYWYFCNFKICPGKTGSCQIPPDIHGKMLPVPALAIKSFF